MNISSSTSQFLAGTTQSARPLVRTITPDGMTLQPEKTEEEKRLESSTFSFQRQLTPEEENRVLFLKNLLAQLLTMANGQPTEDQKSRIREIEKELEKITGVKVKSSISNAVNKMPGTKKDEEDNERKWDTAGIAPEEAVHSRLPEQGEPNNPGMQMLQRNAMHQKLTSLLENSAKDMLSTVKST